MRMYGPEAGGDPLRHNRDRALRDRRWRGEEVWRELCNRDHGTRDDLFIKFGIPIGNSEIMGPWPLHFCFNVTNDSFQMGYDLP